MNDITLAAAGLPILGVFKVNQQASLPQFATEASACFDLKACLSPTDIVKKRVALTNIEVGVSISPDRNIDIHPGDRVLIPTGLIFDIPVGYSVRLHPRSGLSFKDGIVLANAEGIIDADYVDPVFVIVQNVSDVTCKIKHGDRICQGELVKVEAHLIQELNDAPQIKTSRTGGIGSTGQ